MTQKALIFDIKRDSSEDGPGIRTTVFFKGCPMHCIWCQNPEGIEPRAGVSFQADLCQPTCNKPCIKACPSQALELEGTSIKARHYLCTACGRCLETCTYKALERVGYWIDLDELVYRVSIDAPFYQSTGGGVTLSGGEATQQMDFAHAFLRRLKEMDIHTALETCGLFNFERFRRLLLPHLNLIYYDIKLIDERLSRRYTGRSNKPILKNFSRLLDVAEIPVIARIPLVPGITDSAQNLQGIAHFLKSQGIKEASLLPYNPLWQEKMQRLGLDSAYPARSFMSEADIRHCVDIFKAA